MAATKKRSSTRSGYLAILRLDLEALVRGRVEGEELCEITGFGPIPVSRARALLGDSVLKLVLTKGVDVANVTHLGRGANAAQHIALLWSSPLCSVEGCNRTRLQNDHRIDYAQTRHTRLDELDPLCVAHHRLKTYLGWALAPGKGKRAFVPPDDPRHPRNQRGSPSPGRAPPEGPAPPEGRVPQTRGSPSHAQPPSGGMSAGTTGSGGGHETRPPQRLFDDLAA